MHYRNGREAKNGDRVVSFGNGGGSAIHAVGILQNAVPGNDHCNGEILIRSHDGSYGAALIAGACLCDCLHADDVAELLKAAGLDKRPAGK